MIKNKFDEETQELLDLANSQAEDILSILGIRYKKSGIWLMSTCDIHGGDNKHAFAYNLQSNYWKCFTHHCEAEYGSTIIGLVQGILKCPEHAAIDWLFYNIKDAKTTLKSHVKLEDRIYPEFCLKKLFKTDFYLKRGFSQPTLDAFEHGRAESNTMRGRVVFPIRDEDGFIRGFSGRWANKEIIVDGKTICLTDNDKEVPKWRHTSFLKGNYLYNFNVAKPYSSDSLILVESIGNVMRFYDAGFKNCVACLGSCLTSKQMSLIVSTTKELILAFDNDEAGIKACKKSKKKIEQYLNYRIIFPPTGKDWAEITNQELVQIYAGNSKCQL